MAPSAREASALAESGDSVIGWKLDPEQRRELLQQFPPRYARTVADHVTLRSKAADDAPLPEETDGEIRGRADVAATASRELFLLVVVAIAGTTDRPDGSTYHITWSLEEDREARESNDVIAACGWERFDLAMPIRLRPARFG